MSHKRLELQRALCQYVSNTLTYIVAVRYFCKTFSDWKNCREKEVEKIRDIKKRADEIDPSFTKSEGEETSSKEPVTTLEIKSVAELEKLLGEVLKETLEGLEKFNTFSNAVEKLAVTSLQVFTENQILFRLDGISFDEVQALIKSARLICPLLLEFKRDAAAFFVPTRHNVEVLLYQLEKHVNTSERIVKNLSDSLNINISLEMTDDIAVKCGLSDDDMQNMTDQVKQLDRIRMDDDFRMMFLFQRSSYSEFVNKYNDELPKMLQFLDEMEQCAVQLDKMNERAQISSLAENLEGAVGGIMSIVGLILVPFIPDVSVGLTTLAGTSGVKSAITTVVEDVLNRTQTKQANTAFQRLMLAVQRIQDCLEEAAKPPYAEVTQSSEYEFFMLDKTGTNSCDIEKAGDLIGDAVANADIVLQEGKAEHNVTNVASDVPKISQAAAKESFALSKMERYGSIAKNVLFLGKDIFLLIKDSMALAEGTETKVSKFLRARSALWLSEIVAWEKICISLCHSKLTTEENREMLEKPFYPA